MLNIYIFIIKFYFKIYMKEKLYGFCYILNREYKLMKNKKFFNRLKLCYSNLNIWKIFDIINLIYEKIFEKNLKKLS
jgi:hypothetical protein